MKTNIEKSHTTPPPDNKVVEEKEKEVGEKFKKKKLEDDKLKSPEIEPPNLFSRYQKEGVEEKVLFKNSYFSALVLSKKNQEIRNKNNFSFFISDTQRYKKI